MRKDKRKNKRARKARMCENKRTFYTQMKALEVAVKTGDTWYWCPYCHHFHLTSKKSDLHPGNKFFENKNKRN